MMNGSEQGNGQENVKPRRSWVENVHVRGVAILLKLVCILLHDRGDEQGRATKARVCEITTTPHGEFIFVLDVPNVADRGHLLGPKCLHLAALQLLFSMTLASTFRRGERPYVTVGVWDEERERTIMPKSLQG